MKGPCHVWRHETAAERQQSEKDLSEQNARLEPIAKARWEAAQSLMGVSRGGKKARGRVAKWKFTKQYGLKKRIGKGGIDWYRYQEVILKPLLIPFYNQVKEKYGTAWLQEDGAGPHISKEQDEIHALADILRLPWPGNSPDLNQIEPCWKYMKRDIATGPLWATTMDGAEDSWYTEWGLLDQTRINKWIEKMPHRVEQVIACSGGNEFAG